jgi:hypothetical protein
VVPSVAITFKQRAVILKVLLDTPSRVTVPPTDIEARLPSSIAINEGDDQEHVAPATPEKEKSWEHGNDDAEILALFVSALKTALRNVPSAENRTEDRIGT